MPDTQTPRTLWQRLLHEPTVHFFLLALLIFVAYGLSSVNQENVLELDQREIDARVFMQEMATGEELTQEQRDFVAARYVEEQILVREALALGLDNDARIHDMLAQKMLHVLSGEIIQPSDEELQTFYEANIDRYRIPSSRDVIELVFDSRETLPDGTLSLLEAGGSAEALLESNPGSSGPLPNINHLDVSNIFSEEFANQVFASAAGEWAGPFVSNRGQHWLQTTTVYPERLPELSEIRDRVRLEWINSEEEARLQVEISRLFDKYSIVITEAADSEH
ncbi:MAG: peptidyl-prolyl cis-trans isomerase [Pseudomonadales bacterium]|nr:peptidyl-prolyl cis-trans isomerase [Pseudomonadales bacterium]